MTINIKNIVNIVAKKITTADSAEDANLLFGYLNIAQRHGLGQIKEGSDPGAPVLPSDFTSRDQDRLRYDGNELFIRKNAGWSKRRIDQELYQGGTQGYLSMGETKTSPSSTSTFRSSFIIPFASDVGVTSTPNSIFPESQTDGGAFPNYSTHGYVFGGEGPTGLGELGSAYTRRIDSFPFANSNDAATDIGDMSTVATKLGNGGMTSGINGYIAGGSGLPYPPPVSLQSIVQKFNFAAAGTATNVSNLSVAKRETANHSASDAGYVSGGWVFTGSPTVVTTNNIERLPWTTETIVQAPANLAVTGQQAAAVASETHAYVIGGYSPFFPAPSGFGGTYIQKFPFAVTTPTTTVGNLAGRHLFGLKGISSLTKGYYAGGLGPQPNPAVPVPPFPASTTNSYFPYSSESTITILNNLPDGKQRAVSNQY